METRFEKNTDFGPLSLSKHDPVTLTFNTGIQAIIGIETGFTIKLPYYWGQ